MTPRIILPLLALALIAGTASGAEKAFVYHLNAPPDLLDPAKCNNVRCQRVMWAIYEPLVNLSKDLRETIPGLAESWEVSPDGLSYTFHLRRGVRFHDGTPFNAEAAKVNLERNFVPGSPFYTPTPPNVREKLLGGLISEISVKDAHTLAITLKTRKVHLLFFAPIVSPAALTKYGEKLGEHPVGTGPFRLKRWTVDEVRLAANPDYWGGPPTLAELSFRIIRNSERMTEEFLAGQVDFLPEVEPIYIERITTAPSAKLIRVPTLSLYYLGLRNDRRPFSDLRIRRAVTSAIDVDRAILFTSRGMGVPAYGPLPPGVDGHEPSARRAPYRADLGRRPLSEAGYPDGLRASLVFNAGWGFFTELAQAIKTDLAKIGIVVDLEPQPGYKELVAAVRQGRGDLFMYSWFIPSTDPDAWLGPLFRSGSVDNLTRYSNRQLDALLEEARTVVETPRRLELYRAAQRLLVDDAPMVFLFNEVRVSAYNTRVIGLELNANAYPVDRFARIDVQHR